MLATVPPARAQQSRDNRFNHRGFFIDLRSQVMTMDALRHFAGELAGFGINTLVVEWEATYPYKNNATISNEVAYTRAEIASFVSYCNELGVDVVPVQQCFGHAEYILRHDRYRNLSEDQKNISQICPLKEKEASSLFSDLFADQASLHTSKYIHIGGDETRLLGHCAACKEKVAREGVSKLFVDYMRMMCSIVLRLGKTPVIWSDMLLKYPEAANELPKETILVDWNYGWKINHFGNVSDLQRKGFTFWGAPSLRSHPDNWYVTDWQTHFNNQRDFIPYARASKYDGIIMTSWSTSGVYSFIWDVGNTITDMVPIRNNYPLSGFRILIASYLQALNQRTAIDPKSWVVKYAQERFGLTVKEGGQLWLALMLRPELIENGKSSQGKSIERLQEENDTARLLLSQLNPLRNKDEVEHFRLMADLRKYYLDYKKLEAICNQADFTIDKVNAVLNKVERLKEEGVILDKRFESLQKGFLKKTEIEKQNAVRNKPIENLYQRMARKL